MQGKTSIRRLLIANRGEIVGRIARTCRRMGIETVAIYSDLDPEAMHRHFCDRAIHLEGRNLEQTYLNGPRIIKAAVEAKCDAVHPGYGFLSENGLFAKSVTEAGLIFIGPTKHCIEQMGDKIHARKTAAQCGIPVLPAITVDPGVPFSVESMKDMSMPLLVKAARGGGGKGMRIVQDPKDFREILRAASDEAEASFGDGSVYMEKYIPEPHHIEVQILGDMYGNFAALGERECSVQRRHQKMIEECPSPFIDEENRQRMCRAAIQLARAVSYVNAGTVEFLVQENGQFFFLEMNTRLQVEHRVTEKVWDIDMVRHQIEIAAGKPLSPESFHRSDRRSIEFRIYAEKSDGSFAPDSGIIKKYHEPSLESVMIDSAVREGETVHPFFDPMLAKVIVTSADRQQCLKKAAEALQRYLIYGVETNIPLLCRILELGPFRSGKYTTKLLESHREILFGSKSDHSESQREESLLRILGQMFIQTDRIKSGIVEPESIYDSRFEDWKKAGNPS